MVLLLYSEFMAQKEAQLIHAHPTMQTKSMKRNSQILNCKIGGSWKSHIVPRV